MKSTVKLSDLFVMKTGTAGSFDDYTDITDPEVDSVSYISAATTRNGINGFVQPRERDVVYPANSITVAIQGQGSVSFATVQPHAFIASKLVLVMLVNKESFLENGLTPSTETLAVIASLIRKQRWRFSFGRRADPDRLAVMEISLEKIKNATAALSAEQST